MVEPYKKLLSKKRNRKTTIPNRPLAIESESDRSRLIFSAPFRRLQQKAQVFSLEANAAVRSRLTHSIEVAQIGRFLSDQIVEALQKKKQIDAAGARAFVNFVEVACLMHDLGNPPFGHFGEAAISTWFEENGEALIQKSVGIAARKESEEVPENIKKTLADFLEFDGNCQGLRIASLLQWNDDEHGLNLTYTSLASYLKYIRAPLFDASEKKELAFQKKAGFFSTEQQLVEKIWKHFGYDKLAPQRFPLAYVMEAADDIAYCISDIEDSIEKKLLKQNDVFADLRDQWRKILRSNPAIAGVDATAISKLLEEAVNASKKKSKSYTFTAFRTKLSQKLTDIACRSYSRMHDDILKGLSLGLIGEKTAGGMILELLKQYCRKNVYQHESVQRTELAGLMAIAGLLDHFRVLLECSEDRFSSAVAYANKDAKKRPIIVERKLLSLFPDKHLRAYQHGVNQLKTKKLSSDNKKMEEWKLRAHLITDFISGMTDDFALSSYQTLSGIKVTQ